MDAWCDAAGLNKGAVISPDQAWRLARDWYEDRLDEAWRRRSTQETEAIFGVIGLRGDFWRV